MWRGDYLFTSYIPCLEIALGTFWNGGYPRKIWTCLFSCNGFIEPVRFQNLCSRAVLTISVQNNALHQRPNLYLEYCVSLLFLLFLQKSFIIHGSKWFGNIFVLQGFEALHGNPMWKFGIWSKVVKLTRTESPTSLFMVGVLKFLWNERKSIWKLQSIVTHESSFDTLCHLLNNMENIMGFYDLLVGQVHHIWTAHPCTCLHTVNQAGSSAKRTNGALGFFFLEGSGPKIYFSLNT